MPRLLAAAALAWAGVVGLAVGADAAALSCSGCSGRGDAAGADYTVRAGDTLSEIAEARGVRGGAATLYAGNRDVLLDADHVYVGQQLRVGTVGDVRPGWEGATYVVGDGDTLSEIARAHAVTGGAAALLAANRGLLVDADHIYTGQRLRLPGPSGAVLPVGYQVQIRVQGSTGAATGVVLSSVGNRRLVVSEMQGRLRVTVVAVNTLEGRTQVVNDSAQRITVQISRGTTVLAHDSLMSRGVLLIEI